MSKDTHFIDTEVEKLPMTSWDDYDTYCENGERVFDAICDEAALYKIASEAVKKKLDSLNEYGKYYKEQYDKSRNEISMLNQLIENIEKAYDDLQKEIDNAKLEASKELYEDYLRSQNPLGVVAGDTFYKLDVVYKEEDCPYCNGTGIIITQTGKECHCINCNHGKTNVRKGFEIVEKRCERVELFTTYDHRKLYTFHDYCGDEYIPYGQDENANAWNIAFKTREDAQKFIDNKEKESDKCK